MWLKKDRGADSVTYNPYVIFWMPSNAKMWIPARELTEKCRGDIGNEGKAAIDEGIMQNGRHCNALQHLV